MSVQHNNLCRRAEGGRAQRRSASRLQLTSHRRHGLALYDGSLEPSADWQQLVAGLARHGSGIPVITCSAATAELINTGRASWIRVPITLVR
jgi:hypothetical protein